MPTLLSVFPSSNDLLSLTPEDLGGVVIEVAPSAVQNGLFTIEHLLGQVYQIVGPSYPQSTKQSVALALAEAVSWLVTQGLLVVEPGQPTLWYRLTRRAANLRSRIDVEAFVKGRILPDGLLSDVFSQKVVPLFRRGDYDVAVFQAFKEVEVAVRGAANAKGGAIPNTDVGTVLMRKAFHTDTGPLTDASAVPAEREALMHLFAGAIGYAKNPASHRSVVLSPKEAAQLIVFASHMLGVVHERSS